MRKIFSVLLAICIVFTAVPVNAQTAEVAQYVASLPESYIPSASEYYANDLTDFQKRFYTAFVSGFSSIADDELKLKQSVAVEYTVSTDQIITSQQELDTLVEQELQTLQDNLDTQSLYNAIAYDHTEFFWMRAAEFGINISAQADQNGTTLLFTITMQVDATDLFADDLALQTAAKNMSASVDAILSEAPSGKFDTLKYFNQWLCDNNIYNDTHIEYSNYPLAHTALSALTSENVEQNGPVCQGYSYAFKMLCDRVGIPCVVITGTLYQQSKDPGAHAWNAVKLGDNWYAVDVTSNDSLGTNEHSFLAGKGTHSNDSTYPVFAAGHRNDSVHTYPAISASAYSGIVTLDGANIRVGENAGLRFRTTVAKDLLFDKYYQTDDADKTYIYSEENNIVYGTLFLPKDLITKGSSVSAMFKANDERIVDVPAKKIYSQDSDSITFTGVITEIPEEVYSYARSIAAVPYIKYRENDQSEWIYIFGNQGTASYYSVAKKARESEYSNANNPSPSEEIKKIIAQLDAIIELGKENDGYIDGWW